MLPRSFLRLAAVALCSLTVIASAGCQRRSHDKASLPATSPSARIAVRVTTPSAALTPGAARVTGMIRSRQESTLSAKTTAQILSIAVDVGSPVKAGQRLVVLDSRMIAAQLQSARAAARVAEANLASVDRELQRAEALASSGAIADSSLDKARSGHDVASAQLEQARAGIRSADQMMRDSVILAPFDGVVVSRSKSVGDTVSAMPPTPLLTLVDPDHLELRLLVPEGLVGLVGQGDTISATVNPSGTAVKATIRTISSAIDTSTRTVEVLADVVGPLDGSLRTGSLVTAELTGKDGLSGPFLAANAVHSDAASSFVLVVESDKVVRREVVAASVNPGTFWIKSGLKATDRVAIGDADSLHPGTPVVVVAD